MKALFNMTGIVTDVSSLIRIPRKKADMYKKTLTITLKDGQRVFVDVMNKKLQMLMDENISINDIVKVDFTFKGIEKDGRKYNNIFCENIERHGRTYFDRAGTESQGKGV